MIYKSGAAFRRALEDRLRVISLETGTPMVRLRKMIAFDRFLARLFSHGSEQWTVKGGFALQLRLGARARTTIDLDLLATGEVNEIFRLLREVGALDLEDWFSFEVMDTSQSITVDMGGLRYPINSLLDGRTFERFHIDVGTGDSLLAPIEYLKTQSLLTFAGIEPTNVPCYSIIQQIAEKYHAYTRPHVSGASSRVKDFIDILLMASMEELDNRTLGQVIRKTFETRKTHKLPMKVPLPAKEWARPFNRLAKDVGLDYESLQDAGYAFQKFLEPALVTDMQIVWDPTYWHWQKKAVDKKSE